jgi:hypothetical protein
MPMLHSVQSMTPCQTGTALVLLGVAPTGTLHHMAPAHPTHTGDTRWCVPISSKQGYSCQHSTSGGCTCLQGGHTPACPCYTACRVRPPARLAQPWCCLVWHLLDPTTAHGSCTPTHWLMEGVDRTALSRGCLAGTTAAAAAGGCTCLQGGHTPACPMLCKHQGLTH